MSDRASAFRRLRFVDTSVAVVTAGMAVYALAGDRPLEAMWLAIISFWAALSARFQPFQRILARLGLPRR